MLYRTELELIKKLGYNLLDPYDAVVAFEKKVAERAGAPFAVAVDCATHAIELCLRYLQAHEPIDVPCWTYPSVPMTLEHLQIPWRFTEYQWSGVYQLDPYPIIDGSLRFTRSMYQPGTFHCLSFQMKKHVGIGRGGMILTDDEKAFHWFKKACHDGRTPRRRWHDDDIDMLGFHYYMTPDDAARGLLLIEDLPEQIDDIGGWQNYPDLRNMKVFIELAERDLRKDSRTDSSPEKSF